MNLSRKMVAALIYLITAVLAPDLMTHAAGAPNQTTVNPSTTRKSSYPKIVIYTVSWCPHCRETKEYLTSRNIPFINKDVELDPAAMEELMLKYKSTGVPIVVIGNDQEVLKGFTGDQFEKLVEKVRAGRAK